MSAQVAPQLDSVPHPPLRAITARTPSLPSLPFGLIMAVLLGVGMWGILVLNTVIQDQSASLVQLQREARVLGYQEAALRTEVQQLQASTTLAERATALGMVPNPRPAFINLETGAVTGELYRVTGAELPTQTYRPLVVPPKPQPVGDATETPAPTGDTPVTDSSAVSTNADTAADAAVPPTEPGTP